MLKNSEAIHFEPILAAFGLLADSFDIQTYGDGHINGTFLLSSNNQPIYILQRLNKKVFPKPEHIAANWLLAQQIIKKVAPEYIMLHFIQTVDGDNFFVDDEGEYWRLLPFIKNTVGFQSIVNEEQAYQAAAAFGNFASLLKDAPIDQFYTILPDFHDLNWRQQQFDTAMQNASVRRQKKANELILELNSFRWLTDHYNKIIPILPKRIVHMDAKISNILFDASTHKPKCIVDFDTLMPGTILSDLGDLVRSSVCEAKEDETDLSKIFVRNDYFESLIEAYKSSLENLLTTDETKVLPFAGPMLLYMQALRFITDYLNNDIYYTIRYSEHNYDRALNQYTILTQLMEHPLCQEIKNWRF